MRDDHFPGLGSKGFHRIHYTDWGDPGAERIVICAHGLTRSGRDFDDLARALASDFRVVCPDIAGRGQSDWLHAKEDYDYPQYCADMAALVARVTAGGTPRKILWVGTSMGGIIGMLLASRPNSPIARLVLNDVGTIIPKAALERIGAYVGKDPRFNTIEELLRGAQSDLLLKDNAVAMTQRGPRPRLVEFEGIGHAPMLMAGDQNQAVRDFLLAS